MRAEIHISLYFLCPAFFCLYRGCKHHCTPDFEELLYMCILECTYLKEALRTHWSLLGYRGKHDFKYVFILSCLYTKSIQYYFQSIFRVTFIVLFFQDVIFWGWGNRGSPYVRYLFFTCWVYNAQCFHFFLSFASSMIKEMNSNRIFPQHSIQNLSSLFLMYYFRNYSTE